MADIHQPSAAIADRISALNLNHVGQRQPSGPLHVGQRPAPGGKRPPPPPPPAKRPTITHSVTTASVIHSTSSPIGNLPAGPDPSADARRQPPTLPVRGTNAGTRPALPSRQPSASPSIPTREPSISPALPPRRPSQQLTRQTSRDSVLSARSTSSNLTTTSSTTSVPRHTNVVRAPAYDPTTLPPLPPKREKSETQAPTASRYAVKAATQITSRPALPSRQTIEPPPPPVRSHSVAPTLRNLPTSPPSLSLRGEAAAAEPPRPRKSALLQGFGGKNAPPPQLPTTRPNAAEITPKVPVRPSQETPAAAAVPPPVPISSRPDLKSLNLSKPSPKITTNTTTVSAVAPQSGVCLHCRDFSVPDGHAARFDRLSIPSRDPAWLAAQLTSPFDSKTDKARAIFTWLHLNIAYNTAAFFGNNVRGSTPSSTMSSGLAVCEGYAALFTCMATYAGLESRVIGGHGKGFGFSALGPSEPVPPYESGHAWNVVLLDEGWKLIDPCWGAGNVDGATQAYNKAFNPAQFTMDNEEFGSRHFPEDRVSFYRHDGRCPSWEEYLVGAVSDPAVRLLGSEPLVFGNISGPEGIAPASLKPAHARISLARQEVVRFEFTRVCRHWDPERHGKGLPWVYILYVPGQNKPAVFEHNGYAWWTEAHRSQLGAPGGEVMVGVLTSFDDRDGRGVTQDEVRAKWGRCMWKMEYMCRWDIVA